MLFRDLKYDLLKTNDFNFYKKTLFINNLNAISKERPLEDREAFLLDENIAYLFNDLSDHFTPVEIKALNQLYDSRRQKIFRLKNRIKNLLRVSEVYFLTLTFRDDVLQSTSPQTRRTYVQRYLSSLNYVDYYANIDFGNEDKNPFTNFREHYHAIIGFKEFNLIPWEYGFYFYEPVQATSKSLSKISTYVNKLSYHAFKETDLNIRCISPKKKYYPSLLPEVNGVKLYPVRVRMLPFD